MLRTSTLSSDSYDGSYDREERIVGMCSLCQQGITEESKGKYNNVCKRCENTNIANSEEEGGDDCYGSRTTKSI